MVEWLFILALGLSCLVGLSLVLVGLFGRAPNGYLILWLASLEALLLVQTAVAVGMALVGARASVSTLEFFGYLIVAILIPPGSVVWALVEKNKWSTVIMGFSALTVAVMQLRMWQIWFGEAYF
jgi:hypothetical protein